MSLYSMSFGFREPYQVLVDSEMCKEAVSHKIELMKQLGVVLQGATKPMITQCCIHELYLQGKQQQPAVDLAKTFERRKCNHREAIPGDDCLASVVGDTNKHRYVVATHPKSCGRNCAVYQPDATLRAKHLVEEQALHPKAPEIASLPSTEPAEPLRKKRKGPKGPNPLSVKKKAKPNASTEWPKEKGMHKEGSGEARAGEKRKRVEADEPNDSNPTGGEGSGRKRKRRRKPGVSMAPVGTIATET
ncbi:rRNA-processing protein utp23 [Grifola frondosa]|uniref:rRNA-processing protein utp23 n=1 Tax=Grifola frondosa TaxID=5627 RepID=A0A1C7MS46_GRIFR|nr:rRNA-processing protein utp23 [Grifola frondosa]